MLVVLYSGPVAPRDSGRVGNLKSELAAWWVWPPQAVGAVQCMYMCIIIYVWAVSKFLYMYVHDTL